MRSAAGRHPANWRRDATAASAGDRASGGLGSRIRNAASCSAGRADAGLPGGLFSLDQGRKDQRPAAALERREFPVLIQTPGGKQWPTTHIEAGTFAWKRVRFSVRVPDDAQSMTLFVGLESVTGKVWFDDIRVWLLHTPIVRPEQAVAGPVYRGHDLPRLRGAVVRPEHRRGRAANVRPAVERQRDSMAIDWPAHSVKDPLDLAAYDAWLHAELDKLDAVLPVCRQAGLYVAVVLMSPPGGRVALAGGGTGDAGLFNHADCQAKFVEVWRNIARRYKQAEAVWGYDLVNEPDDNSVEEGLADWQQLAERAGRAVREFDARHAIIVEPASGGGPDGFVDLALSTSPTWSTVFICTSPWRSPIKACLDQASRFAIPASLTASHGIRPGSKWR